MATFTWLGGGTNSFGTPSNWHPDGPPDDGDTIIMPSGLSMDITGGMPADNVFTLGSDDAIGVGGATITGASIIPGAGFTLDVTGGTLETAALSVGSGSTISLTGSSLFSVDGNLVDGNAGAAQTTVTTGGTVSVTGTLIVGDSADSAGALVISGGGTVSVRAASTGPFAGVVLGDATAAAGSLIVGGGSGAAALNDFGDLVDGASGVGRVQVTTGGTVTIGGTLYVGGTSPLNGGAGTMQVTGGLLAAQAVELSPGSTLSAAASGAIVAIGGASANQGIDVAPGTSLFGAGVVTGNVADNGALVADVPLAALLLNGGSITGSGSLVIAPAATLEIFTTVHYTNPVTFTGAAGVLRVEAPAALESKISGFGVGNAIDLPGLTFPPTATLSYDGVAGVLHLGLDAFQVGTGYIEKNFTLRHEATGTGTEIVFVACFAAGTHVLTTQGEARVETLRPGDVLPALSGRLGRLRWIGRTRVTVDRHPQPEKVAPIRIAPGAFGEGVPHAPLRLSPDHAVLAGGVLIPVHLLVNGGSIAQEPAGGLVEYLHLELDRHDVVVVEGFHAESYLDTGNRGSFAETDIATAKLG